MQRIQKPIMPGDVIDANVQRLAVSYTDFAEQCGMEPWNVCQIVNGNRRISVRWAVALEPVTGISAFEWLKMQAMWDLWKFQWGIMGNGSECGMCGRSFRKCECEELKGDSNDAKGEADREEVESNRTSS